MHKGTFISPQEHIYLHKKNHSVHTLKNPQTHINGSHKHTHTQKPNYSLTNRARAEEFIWQTFVFSNLPDSEWGTQQKKCLEKMIKKGLRKKNILLSSIHGWLLTKFSQREELYLSSQIFFRNKILNIYFFKYAQFDPNHSIVFWLKRISCSSNINAKCRYGRREG